MNYFSSKFLSFYRKKKPFLKNPDNCVKCLSCVNNCPVKAISVKNGKITFDYNKCINCMVCIESCKYNALSYKLGFPAKIIHPLLKFVLRKI